MMQLSIVPPPAVKRPGLTVKKDELRVRRMRVAAYLYQLAEAVRKGEIESFEARWDEGMADLDVDLRPVFGVSSDP
jgi:hypothetical protein